MTEDEVLANAYAMPLTNPAFPTGPYRFVNREFFIITYRTDPDALRAVVPAPLMVAEPLVKYEFIRMPDSTGFGDYTESGQVIRSLSMACRRLRALRCISTTRRRSRAAASCGAFPKKLAAPSLTVDKDTLIGVLGTVQCGGHGHDGLQAPRAGYRRDRWRRWRRRITC